MSVAIIRPTLNSVITSGPVFVMNYDGSMISSVLPPMPVKADLRAAQMEASNAPRVKFQIAKALVEAKIARSIQVLEWLAERYDISREVMLIKRQAVDLRRACTVGAIRSVEGRVALKYWNAYGKVLPESLDFQGRMMSSHQNNATDPVNAALNYGYGFLEGECRRAINTLGLEPCVGFLHDSSDYQTKQSLVYDLQESFRWLVDLSVVYAFESEMLDLHDFFFTGDDYRYRFETEAKQRFIRILRERFNEGVTYKDRVLNWDTIIGEKALELGRFLVGKSSKLDFKDPSPNLKRSDSKELSERIQSLTAAEARRQGINKSTLYTLHQHARNGRSFRLYGKVRRRLLSVNRFKE